MKKILLATASLSVFAIGAAEAADLPRKAASPVVAARQCAAQQFQGFYIGISGGGAYHEAHRNDTDGFLTDNGSWTKNKWGGIAGGQAGYNWTTCNTLWGVEIDGSWVGVKNTLRDDPNDIGDDNFINSKLNTLVTARLRTGLVLDNLLLYVTGGFAAAHHKTTWNDTPLSVEFKEWRYGWTAGFGTEWAWTPGWSIKSEVLYASFADRDRTATLDGTTYTFRHSDSVWVSRIGLNYRWGGGAPVVARY
jgi:outer membrane immunogenic protein